MAVKRKIKACTDSEDKLYTRSERLEQSGKKKRVDAVLDVAEVGDAPSETGIYQRFTRSKYVQTQKTVNVEAKVDVLKDGCLGDMSDDDGASMNSTEREDFEAERLKYEEDRNRIVEENRKRLQELGLPDLTKGLSSTKRTDRKKWTKRLLDPGFQPRRSARYANRPAGSNNPKYKDFFKVKVERKEYALRSKDSNPVNTKEEIYTEEHIKLLGSCETEWKLFNDGYYPGGGRIYDSVNGKTCHQCRQKTLGERTLCGSCKSLSGQLCGECLSLRYGENLLEAKSNLNWVCPVCRGICNCSSCRLKQGWAPTGKNSLTKGFPSVAHYLIMTFQRRPACENEKVDDGEKVGEWSSHSEESS